MCFFPGTSTPIILGIVAFTSFLGSAQPWHCLWRGLVQITRTTPLRRTMRQFSQMRRTELRTFICCLFFGWSNERILYHISPLPRKGVNFTFYIPLPIAAIRVIAHDIA